MKLLELLGFDYVNCTSCYLHACTWYNRLFSIFLSRYTNLCMYIIHVCTCVCTCGGCFHCFCSHDHLQGRPIIICCRGDTAVQAKAYRYLEIPQTVDCLQGILAVIPLQLLAFHIAVIRKHDVCFVQVFCFTMVVFLISSSFDG